MYSKIITGSFFSDVSFTLNHDKMWHLVKKGGDRNVLK